MPTGWRIVKTRYAADAFSGEGARLYGGRWGSPGVRMVYTSSTRALAILEVLVHVNDAALLRSFSMGAVHFEDSIVEHLDRALLPADWRDYPAPSMLQQIGDDWARRRSSVVLEVPSAVEGTESNYLLNPNHPEFVTLTFEPCEPYPFDARLAR